MDNTASVPTGVIGSFCSACGTKLSNAVNFCSSCGNQLSMVMINQTASVQTVAPSPSTQDQESSQGGSEIGLGTAWGIYAAAVGFELILISLGWISFAIISYWVIGFIMTRVVMRNLIEWHPVHATLDNVVGAKVMMFLAWPLYMLNLLVKLSIHKAL